MRPSGPTSNPLANLAPPIERYFAYFLEGFPLLFISWVPVAGPLLTVVYILFRDALFRGQSVGKKLLKLRVVVLANNSPPGLRESALRNFPLAIVYFLPLLPLVGYFLSVAVGSAVFFVEAIMIAAMKDGRRFGDQFAGTVVIRNIDEIAR